MTVYFIGAGPGAADLITVRGQRTLGRCGVCLYAGSLVPPELLADCPPDARLVDTANLDLDQILAEIVRAHGEGQDVARLHSGDPSVFSAMAEQMRRLDAADIPYEVVPGVPAFAAAAAALKRELTVPTVGQTVILTRVARQATPMPPGEELDVLGKSGALLVLHLAARYVDSVVEELLPHYGPDCPAAVVAMASRPDELVLRGTLGDIAVQVKAAGVLRTAVIIVGQTLAATEFRDSHLYSTARAR
ncbi:MULTISPECIES: precorrin-4 C(11)-methyltransferase [Kitasatospora]|uniref:Putative precorrin-4 C11-methyltransferase n=1 Tax=Kitasatospora setae (strain ATCC 33774 / DSM 43861 / JCM 3304 / KCC A-0304 / NBRC 14216 / KM-6054) TaxID=452652 RepID=E4N270_KITSK|nr:precorrin-4 C(11)-methyltransferase [Kitasatospora setae]BAJ32254.1 putative precorrin-4 C11-methyltransferase [Kitasatospora setae KM-6054]